MATTTVRVRTRTKTRLDYYKTVFGFASVDVLITDIMNRLGMASYEDIKRLQKLQHKEGSE